MNVIVDRLSKEGIQLHENWVIIQEFAKGEAMACQQS
jgi:hypothetical protein